jgi:hypothetical protein
LHRRHGAVLILPGLALWQTLEFQDIFAIKQTCIIGSAKIGCHSTAIVMNSHLVLAGKALAYGSGLLRHGHGIVDALRVGAQRKLTTVAAQVPVTAN